MWGVFVLLGFRYSMSGESGGEDKLREKKKGGGGLGL